MKTNIDYTEGKTGRRRIKDSSLGCMCTDEERWGENGRGDQEEVIRKDEAQAGMVPGSTAFKHTNSGR